MRPWIAKNGWPVNEKRLEMAVPAALFTSIGLWWVISVQEKLRCASVADLLVLFGRASLQDLRLERAPVGALDWKPDRSRRLRRVQLCLDPVPFLLRDTFVPGLRCLNPGRQRVHPRGGGDRHAACRRTVLRAVRGRRREFALGGGYAAGDRWGVVTVPVRCGVTGAVQICGWRQALSWALERGGWRGPGAGGWRRWSGRATGDGR